MRINDGKCIDDPDAVLFGLSDVIVCPHCGANATINLHTEQGELIDYFYECSCGGMFEDTKRGLF